MKKTIKTMAAVAVAMMMGFAANAKTWTNFTGFGFMAGTDTDVDVKDSDNHVEVTKLHVDDQYGLEGTYMGVHQNGFAVRGMFDLWSCDMDNKVTGYDYTQLGLDMMVGAGFAPVRSEKFTLGLFGMIGITGASAQGEKKSSYDSGYGGYIDRQYTFTYAAFECGGNVTAVYTPTNCFSVWASLTAAYVTPGAYNWKGEYSTFYADDDLNYDTEGTYRVMPAIGVCWRF